jgi:hypothetical protein
MQKKSLTKWFLLLVVALTLTACAKSPMMVKCPDCGSVFDATQHQVERP